jgi:hypothetical protein
MLGLFYPAVLGAIFYSFLPFIRQDQLIWPDLPAFVISLGLLVHFCVDYVYTEFVERYSLLAFVSDLSILYLLYLAFDSVNYLNGTMNFVTASAALAGVYAMFILWDWSLRKTYSFWRFLMIFEGGALISFSVLTLVKAPGVWLAIVLIIASIGLLLFTLDVTFDLELSNRNESHTTNKKSPDLPRRRFLRGVEQKE